MRRRARSPSPSAVSQGLDSTELPRYASEHSDGIRYRLVVYVEHGVLQDSSQDEFYDDWNPQRGNLLDTGTTEVEYDIYEDLRGSVSASFAEGDDLLDVKWIDVPVTDTLVLTNGVGMTMTGPLTVGHDGVGSTPTETRAFLKFGNLQQSLPEGFTPLDVEDAQLIVMFDSDSQLTDETDTGVIRVHPVTAAWGGNYSGIWNEYWEPTIQLGAVDLPPHIITAEVEDVQEETENVMPEPDGLQFRLRVLPLPSGTPVSFGHDADLRPLVYQWYDEPENNHGVVLVADRLDALPGDQRVHFLRDASLRLTLRRD